MIYYVSGLPYSDELYHHGILGQKWGIRRYQNPDGTRTALGKARYAAGAVGNSIKQVGSMAMKRASENYRKKHPELMSEKELRARMSRIEMENRYKDMLRQNNRSTSRGKQVVQDILENSAKSFASNIVNNISQIAKEKALNNIRAEYDKKQKKREKKYEQEKYKRDLQRDEARFQKELERDDKRYEISQARKDAEYKKDKKRSDKEYYKSLAGKFEKSVGKTLDDLAKSGGDGMNSDDLTKLIVGYGTVADSLRKIESRSGSGKSDKSKKR